MAMKHSVPQPPADIGAVRAFWERRPLFVGESRHQAGDKAFFEEHASARLNDLSGALNPIFVCDVAPGRDVLDVGCGPGFWVREFCQLGARVSACDLAHSAVKLTRRQMELFGLAAGICQGDAEHLPYADANFDHVNCQGVIHHTPDPVQCIREFERVLRPRGTLCFSVYYRVLPLRWPWLYRILSWSTRSWLGMPGRGREKMMRAPTAEELVRFYDGSENPIGRAFTRQELDAMLGDRFRVLRTLRVGFPRRVLPVHLSDGLHRWLSRCFGLMLVLRCRKS